MGHFLQAVFINWIRDYSMPDVENLPILDLDDCICRLIISPHRTGIQDHHIQIIPKARLMGVSKQEHIRSAVVAIGHIGLAAALDAIIMAV